MRPRKAKAGPELPQGAPDALKHATELEGEWSLVEGFMGGKAMDPVMLPYLVREFRGNRTTLKFGPRIYIDAAFTLDRSQNPRAIDYSHVTGMYAGARQAGIYECDGTILKLSTAPAGQARPSDFAKRDGNTVTIFRKRSGL